MTILDDSASFSRAALYPQLLTPRFIQLALPNSRKGLAKFIFLEQLRSLHESDAAVGTFVSNVRSMLEVVEGYMGLILRITDSHLAPHEYGVLALEAMSFVRNIQMRALEAKWSSRLHERLVQEGYKSSAGLALAREASCLDWNSERARKEQLLTRAMSELGGPGPSSTHSSCCSSLCCILL